MFMENFVIYISFKCHDVPYGLAFAGSMMLYIIIYNIQIHNRNMYTV